MYVEAFVALGSNLGERALLLEGAARALGRHRAIELVAASRVYETEPVLGIVHVGAVRPRDPEPDEVAQGPYLNAVVQLRTGLGAGALLAFLLDVERRSGRRRERETRRWAARRLDLDLLLYGERRIREPGLEVPHPRLHERAFVLEPLCDLAAERRHPSLGDSFAALARRVRDPERVKVWSAWPSMTIPEPIPEAGAWPSLP